PTRLLLAVSPSPRIPRALNSQHQCPATQQETAMSQWFRIFGRSDVPLVPAALAEDVQRLHPGAAVHFRGDDLGWFAADLLFDPDTPAIRIERYLTKEDDIRADLNTWAAWLESAGETPEHARLMRRIISTAQLITLHQPNDDNVDDVEDDPRVEELCIAVCRFLAGATDGIYQVDNRGFFAADGSLLVAESK